MGKRTEPVRAEELIAERPRMPYESELFLRHILISREGHLPQEWLERLARLVPKAIETLIWAEANGKKLPKGTRDVLTQLRKQGVIPAAANSKETAE